MIVFMSLMIAPMSVMATLMSLHDRVHERDGDAHEPS